MREGVGSAPKPMNMIGERPLLWHVMRYYAHFGHTEFVLCLGYGAAAVKEYFLRYDETQSNDFTLRQGGRDITLHSSDITDWTIDFVDTGLHSTIGERLMRVREHIGDDEMFLANYADTLTDAPLDEMVERFRQSDAVVSLLAVPPVSTHHVVDIGEAGQVTAVREIRRLQQWENGGYFAMRPQVFDALREREDLVPHGLARLVGDGTDGKVMAQRHDGFWRAVDTFRDRAELEDLYQLGQCPWMLWDQNRNAAARDRVRRANGAGGIAPSPRGADAVLAG